MSLILNIESAQFGKAESNIVVDPITWPHDFSICVTDTTGLSVLIHPGNLIQPFQKPIVTGFCASNYWISWTDQVFAFDELEYCLKVLRTWTIISTCHGTQVHVQVIKVIIKNGPITPCNAP
jgi:hypothetical protein